ncbi:MAG TPA: hypothetical protein VMJ30_03945 [Gemmatimonadales bacterium]|nr:hypothetical protein [Gemmatimonadales bacterium]
MTRTSRTVLVALLLVGCAPGSTRPPFDPFPTSAKVELELARTDAIQKVADALKDDSFPIARLEVKDGWLESAWFDPASKQAATSSLATTGLVRIRAWADPGRPYHSDVTVEAVMRPVADPSMPGRSLERPLAADHPVTVQLDTLIKQLVTTYGDKSAADSVGKAVPGLKPHT